MASLSRFQGCLLGVLVGDCLGAPFEGLAVVSKGHLNKYFQQLLNPSVKLPFKPYTDDTVMTKSVALSLIHSKGFDGVDMARRFVDEYVRDPRRGYGRSVPEVFQALRLSNFEDVYGPAARQFGGQGSFGNGAAMRVAPLALCATSATIFDLVSSASRLTHSNKLGIRGAVLQALALRQALALDANSPVDTLKFVDSLIADMAAFEKDELPEKSKDPLTKDQETSYVAKLGVVKSFLSRGAPPTREEIDEFLGMGVEAIRSVPTAVYCYLLAQGPIPEIESDNVLVRTLNFAYNLGGDTDTIGAMAGALSGAQFGVEGIPQTLLSRCEGSEQVMKWGEELHGLQSVGASDKLAQKS